MTEINIVIPESLIMQRAELEAALTEIARAEEKLAAQRKDIQTALTAIATGIAVLSGKPIPTSKPLPGDKPARKPMSEEAKRRIGEGLRKAREAKAQATQKVPASAVPAPNSPTPEPTANDAATEKRRTPKASRKPVRTQ